MDKVANAASRHSALVAAGPAQCVTWPSRVHSRRSAATANAKAVQKRRQWNSKARILNLNLKGRRQTKKRRSTVPIAWQVALHLDAVPVGWFVGPKSIRSAWRGMAAEIGPPDEGEAGTKLIRRSMAHLLRHRGVPVEQLEMMLGHRAIESTSELYAPFSPVFLADARTAIEAAFDEIETPRAKRIAQDMRRRGRRHHPHQRRKNG